MHSPRRMHGGWFREPVMERRGEWGRRRGMVYVNAATLSEINFRRSLLSTAPAFAIHTRPPVEIPLSFSPISSSRKTEKRETGSLRTPQRVLAVLSLQSCRCSLVLVWISIWKHEERVCRWYLKEFDILIQHIYRFVCMHRDGLDEIWDLDYVKVSLI